MTDQDPQKRNGGFTLVEVLIAGVVMSIGCLAVATMVTSSTLQDSRAYHATQASLLLEACIEKAGKLQYSETGFASLSNSSASTTISGVDYLLQCSVVDDTPTADCKEMTCTVSWNNKGHAARVQNTYVYSRKY